MAIRAMPDPGEQTTPCFHPALANKAAFNEPHLNEHSGEAFKLHRREDASLSA